QLDNLIKIHQEFLVGSTERKEQLASLKVQAEAALALVKTLPQLSQNENDWTRALESLAEEGFHESLISVLQSYYVSGETNRNLYGVKFGAALIKGHELGCCAGVLTDSLGHKYLTVGIQSGTYCGLGLSTSLTQWQGKLTDHAVFTSNSIEQIIANIFPERFDRFGRPDPERGRFNSLGWDVGRREQPAGNSDHPLSNVSSAALLGGGRISKPNRSTLTELHVAGLRLNETSQLNSVKVIPLFWRGLDLAQVRESLGLTYPEDRFLPLI
ncbi:MAG: hypothetical protein ABIQ95_11645, partial [Bdellovibrionia bacterium]